MKNYNKYNVIFEILSLRQNFWSILVNLLILNYIIYYLGYNLSFFLECDDSCILRQMFKVDLDEWDQDGGERHGWQPKDCHQDERPQRHQRPAGEGGEVGKGHSSVYKCPKI